MPTVVMDFSGVNPTPPSGGDRRDHIPMGVRYIVAVKEAEYKASRSGLPMWKFAFTVEGPSHAGSQLVQYYTIQKSNGERNDLGLGQVMYILQMLGLNVTAQSVSIPTERLVGLKCEIEVRDELYTPDNGAARLQSEIVSYFRHVPGAVAAAPAATMPPAAPAMPPAAPAPAPAAPVAPPAPAPVAPPAPAPAAPVAPPPAPAPAVEVTDLSGAVPAPPMPAAPVAAAPDLAAEVDSLFQ